MEKIEIKPYEEQYWDQICRIHDQARRMELEYASLEDAFLPLVEAAKREGLFEYKHIEIAFLEDSAAGFCVYSDKELAWLYVLPGMQRRGIGRRMIQHALETEPGLYYVEVLYGNEPARKLYESFGFVVKEILTGQMPGNEEFEVRVYSMCR